MGLTFVGHKAKSKASMVETGSRGAHTCVLVTGGAGYVGSHACEALANAGFCPVVYDNLSRGHESLVRYGPLERGDIRDRARLSEVMGRCRPIAVMHFAALADVAESVADPAVYYDNNVAGALTLMQAMRDCGISRLVFSSTCATYGMPCQQPITEEARQMPINPYGRSKLMIEQALIDHASAYGLNSVSLRYFNACGAHPSGAIGELHDPETHLIPRALMAVLGQIEALQVFGTDYPTSDGTAVRDYIHVCDLAAAHVAALRYLLGGGDTIALNLGTGRGRSVREIIDSVRRVTGREVPVRHGPRRPGDPPVLIADPTKAKALLDFRAQWTDLDDIVGSAWRWHSQLAASQPSAPPRLVKA